MKRNFWINTGNKITGKKEDYFAWARKWDFADKKASKPQDYIYAVQLNIQEHAAKGYLINIRESLGEMLVFNKINQALDLSDEECERLAKQILL